MIRTGRALSRSLGRTRLLSLCVVGVLAAMIALVAAGSARAGPSAVSAVDLGMLPGFMQSIASGVNTDGTVVGYSTGGRPDDHATLWKPSQLPPEPTSDGRKNERRGYTAIDLGTLPGGASSQATGINADGVVTGWVLTDRTLPLLRHAVVWRPDGRDGYSIVDLGTTPGGNASTALAINAAGDVVGYAGNSDIPDYRAIVWVPQESGYRLIDLGALLASAPSGNSAAAAISPSGVILGNSYNSSTGMGVNVLWKPSHDDTFTATILQGVNASAISPSGVLAGSSSGQAAVWKPTAEGVYSLADLGVLAGHSDSVGSGVNAAGVVVGYSSGPDFVDPLSNRATAWVPTPAGYVITDLGALPTGTASQARAISANGLVVGVSDTGAAPRLGRATLWRLDR